jgi:hypothetical protein
MSDTGGAARPDEPKPGRKSGQGMPWQLMVAGLAWITLGMTALVAALSGGGGSGDADAGSVGKVQGSLGSSAASVGERGGANAAVLVIIGLAALLLTGMVLLGQSWARLALSVVGAVAVIYFALTVGVLETLIAMVVLVIGSLLLLLPASVNNYLKG